MRSATKKKTGRDPAYLDFIRSLPCVCCFNHRGIESAHVGERGLSQRCPDREAIPLCKWHHTEGPESHHRLGKRFWAKWNLNRDELIAQLQSRYNKEKVCR